MQISLFPKLSITFLSINQSTPSNASLVRSFTIKHTAVVLILPTVMVSNTCFVTRWLLIPVAPMTAIPTTGSIGTVGLSFEISCHNLSEMHEASLPESIRMLQCIPAMVPFSYGQYFFDGSVPIPLGSCISSKGFVKIVFMGRPIVRPSEANRSCLEVETVAPIVPTCRSFPIRFSQQLRWRGHFGAPAPSSLMLAQYNRFGSLGGALSGVQHCCVGPVPDSLNRFCGHLMQSFSRFVPRHCCGDHLT